MYQPFVPCLPDRNTVVIGASLSSLGVKGHPAQRYKGEGRGLPQLYLKGGTVYNVTDYGLEEGQIHFTTGEESGTKPVEHVIRLR